MKKTSDMGCVVVSKAESASEAFELALHEGAKDRGRLMESLDYIADMSVELAAMALKAECSEAAKLLLQASQAARREVA